VTVRIAVISDVHAALQPFASAISAARQTGFDHLILLGDLFTYGIDPIECAALAAEAIQHDGAILVGGNHDQLYIDMERGNFDYFSRLPDWIRESVEWTWSELGSKWPQSLEYTEEWTNGPLLLAHANPFGYGDWTYLANEGLLKKAAGKCAERGFSYGVFGHLHRWSSYRDNDTEIHIVGSTGQPRSCEDPAPHWSMIEMDDDAFSISREYIDFDSDAHVAAIRNTKALSDRTKDMLCGYYI